MTLLMTNPLFKNCIYPFIMKMYLHAFQKPGKLSPLNLIQSAVMECERERGELDIKKDISLEKQEKDMDEFIEELLESMPGEDVPDRLPPQHHSMGETGDSEHLTCEVSCS